MVFVCVCVCFWGVPMRSIWNPHRGPAACHRPACPDMSTHCTSDQIRGFLVGALMMMSTTADNYCVFVVIRRINNSST